MLASIVEDAHWCLGYGWLASERGSSYRSRTAMRVCVFLRKKVKRRGRTWEDASVGWAKAGGGRWFHASQSASPLPAAASYIERGWTGEVGRCFECSPKTRRGIVFVRPVAPGGSSLLGKSRLVKSRGTTLVMVKSASFTVPSLECDSGSHYV